MKAKNAKIPKKQCQIIVALYTQGKSKKEIARMMSISDTSVRRILERESKNPAGQTVAQTQEDVNKDVIQYVLDHGDKVKCALGNILDVLSDPASLKGANVSQLATCYGILLDKQAGLRAMQEREGGGVHITIETTTPDDDYTV